MKYKEDIFEEEYRKALEKRKKLEQMEEGKMEQGEKGKMGQKEKGKMEQKDIGAIISGEKLEGRTIKVKLTGIEDEIWNILKILARSEGYPNNNAGVLSMLMRVGILKYKEEVKKIAEEKYKIIIRLIEEIE